MPKWKEWNQKETYVLFNASVSGIKWHYLKNYCLLPGYCYRIDATSTLISETRGLGALVPDLFDHICKASIVEMGRFLEESFNLLSNL